MKSGKDLEKYLMESPVAAFLIICDVNLPDQNGFAVKKKLSENPAVKYKSVPFIYWSTSASEKQIQYAYDLPAHGFFVKPSDFGELYEMVKTILSYWDKSQHPKKTK